MTTLTSSELHTAYPFTRSPGGVYRYTSLDGRWAVERQPDARWLLTDLTTNTVTEVPNVMGARRHLAGMGVAPITTAGGSRNMAAPEPEAAETATAPETAAEKQAEAKAEAKEAMQETQVISTAFKGNARKVIKSLIADLNGKFKERKDTLESLMAAILVGENVLMLGPPGTAKSAMARAIAAGFDATYFERLLTKQSKPDELFGPPSLAALKEGRYEREIKGWLPTVNFGFVDETLNGSPAILNNLLTLMNERIFHNGQSPVRCPLVTLFGATNNLPETKELDALWDRFLVRVIVNYVDRDSSLMDLLDDPEPTSGIQLSLDVLRAAQAEVAAVSATNDTKRAIVEIRNALRGEKIIVSDRRLKKVLKLSKAFAWLDGETQTAPEYLAKCVDALWSEPKHRAKIVKVVGQFSDSVTVKCNEILSAADEVVDTASAAAAAASSAGARVAHFAQAAARLREMSAKMIEVRDAAPAKGRKAAELAMASLQSKGEDMKAAAAKAAKL